MQIGKSTWNIKDPCPHCGQGYPEFCFCPACGYVTVACDETGETFINPKKLEEGFTDICPKCGNVQTADFETADSNQIRAAGFQPGEYK